MALRPAVSALTTEIINADQQTDDDKPNKDIRAYNDANQNKIKEGKDTHYHKEAGVALFSRL